MAQPTDRHGPIAPTDADRMDLTVVAALLGVGAQPTDMLSQAHDLARRRAEAAARNGQGRPLRWADLHDG